MTEQSNTLKTIFPKPSIVAYRRPKNLRDILVRAKIRSKRRSIRIKSGFKPCGGACRLCWHSVRSTTHTCHRTGKIWSINSSIDCNSKSVVYKLLCKKCKLWCYIGETGRLLRQRMAEHRGYITQKTNHPVGQHFNSPGHSVADLQVIGIEKVFPSRKKNSNLSELRKIRESYWINKYDCVRYGANTRD